MATYEPCSKCLTSWHQIRKCLRHCLPFAYERTGFAYAHILSYAELTLALAYAYHSFAYATALQGAPCLTWTQGFKTWLTWKHATTSAQPRGWPRSPMIATPKMIRWKPWDLSMKGKHQPYIIHSILEMCVLSFWGLLHDRPLPKLLREIWVVPAGRTSSARSFPVWESVTTSNSTMVPTGGIWPKAPWNSIHQPLGQWLGTWFGICASQHEWKGIWTRSKTAKPNCQLKFGWIWVMSC